mgnify:CR=1 FL=1|jgi:hypothetical protein
MERTIVVIFSLPATPEGLDEGDKVYPLAASLPAVVDFTDAPTGYALGVLALVALWRKWTAGEGV